MKNLARLQRAFQRHVYRPGSVMNGAVRATEKAGAGRRLGIYVHGYSARLVEALGIDYPALRNLLGEAGNARLMREFVAAHPSRHANLRWYGSELAGFLANSARWRRRPRLAELARFEWALGLAFDAADAPLTTPEQVSNVPASRWAGMHFRLHPSVQLLQLRSNAPQAWGALMSEKGPPPSRMGRHSKGWLIWRKEHQPFFRALSPAEAWALRAAAREQDFGTIVGGLKRFVGIENAAQSGAQLLRNWLSEGLICGLDPGP